MDRSGQDTPLSALSTQWSLIFDAHKGQGDEALNAQAVLLRRYCGAIHGYLLSIARDPHLADDLCQEFALRFIRGGFEHVNPEKGRFRDYVKTAVYHLLTDHYRRIRTLPGSLPDDSAFTPAVRPEIEEIDRKFVQEWRGELLNSAWDALGAYAEVSGGNYYQVLRLRAENADVPVAELAEKLNAGSERKYSEAGIRQIIHRARAKFAELLLDEVARSIQTEDIEQLQQELVELELLSYCRTALQERAAKFAGTSASS